MDQPKQKRMWIDQDVIDSPLYVQKSKRNFGQYTGVICHGNNIPMSKI